MKLDKISEGHKRLKRLGKVIFIFVIIFLVIAVVGRFTDINLQLKTFSEGSGLLPHIAGLFTKWGWETSLFVIGFATLVVIEGTTIDKKSDK